VKVSPPAEVAAFRARFPIFRERIHLASNSMGAVSDAVLEAHQVYLEERLRHGASWKYALPRHEALREEFAALIGANLKEIAICCSATQALGVIASCFDWRERPGIVFDDYSFPSVTYLWRAQQQRGARVRQVRVNSLGQLNAGDFIPTIDASTQLVCVSHVCYKNGHRLNIGDLARETHEAGALLVVDDYQACGSRGLDVKALDIDILVTGTSKYLLGSPGLGLMYVREGLFERLHPTVTGWFGQEDPQEFQIDRHDEARDARRFQTGTPAFSAVYDSLAAARLLSSVGLARIESWIDQLTAMLMSRLAERGIGSPTPADPGRRGAQVTIRSVDAPAAVAELAKRGIICSHRDGNIRTAWHFYNTFADVEALIGALDEMPGLISGAR
jgi:selenocysteine lyase/cysteine desulfurase